MKTLIAIVSCHMLADRRKAIRETWLPLAQDVDVRFFLGQGKTMLESKDEVLLDVDDSYRGLPSKTKAICKWALDNGYEFLWKCDDDVYLQPLRLLKSGYESLDYMGRKRGPSGGRPAPYASGFCYGLSPKAMKVVADMKLSNDPAEDRCVGNELLQAGIQCSADYRMVVTNVVAGRTSVSGSEGPRQGNSVIAACEYSPAGMHKAHHEWLTAEAGEVAALSDAGPFGKISVLIKTFKRDGYLLRCVRGVTHWMPQAKLVVVDDGHESSFKITWYSMLRKMGHIIAWLPFDSGFGAKANCGVGHSSSRPYVLVGSDDFDFDQKAMEGILRLIEVLDEDPSVDVASGRVNGRPYEATLTVEGADCYERAARFDAPLSSLQTRGGVRYHACDLTVNYSLIRREVFEKVSWDSDVKIGGGEHGAFYLDLQRHGFKVVWVEDVNINELKGTTDWSAPDYAQFRGRARQPGRICLKRRGIDRFHLMGGSIETT